MSAALLLSGGMDSIALAYWRKPSIAITIDYETRENGTVTIRERDTMTQVRVLMEEVPGIVKSLINGSLAFYQLKV